MSPDWYQRATEELQAISRSIRSDRPIDLTELARIGRGVTASLATNDDLVTQALATVPSDPIISNLVHVGIFGTKLGIGLNFSGEELEHLTLAGLLHDIGIFTLPPELLSKAGKLTPQERQLLERHPIAGHDIVAHLGPRFGWLASVILQAHERWGGQGYPHRLKGRAIQDFAHVIGICDIFDALISSRPYRRRLLPHEAIRELFQKEQASFPREILKALVEQLSVYPLGTMVRLNTGEVGVVIRLNPRYPLRPVVRVDQPSSRPGMVSAIHDLSAVPSSYVTETLQAPTPQAFQSPPPRSDEASLAPTPCSDEFTTLLDSLDEIASAIQDAVNSHAVPSEPGRAEPMTS